MSRILRSLCLLIVGMLVAGTANAANAADLRGIVSFGGLPVPGATVTVTQGGKKLVTVTDAQGFYTFPALADGPAAVEVAMTGFAALKLDVTVGADAALGKLELKLLSLDEMRAALKPVLSAPFTVTQARVEPVKTNDAPKPTAAQAQAAANAPPPEADAARAADGLLVNGSVNNASTSQFSMAQRFGNTASGRSLYTYSLNVREENSALDAKSYSIAGFNSTKPQTNQLAGGFAVQGPLKIPHLLRNGPNVFIQYQRTENSVSTATPGLVPTLAQRSGIFTQPIYAPLTGLSQNCLNAGVTPGAAFAGNTIPGACLDPAAQALLNLYPLPLQNLAANLGYNYQIPLVTDTHQDAVNSNVSKGIGRKNQVTGTLAAQSTRTSFANLFGFVDRTSGLGINTTVSWSHTFNAHLRQTLGYQFSRQSNRTTPF